MPAVHIDVIPSTPAPASAPVAHPLSCDAGRDQTLAQGAGAIGLVPAPAAFQPQLLVSWAAQGLSASLAAGLGHSAGGVCLSWQLAAGAEVAPALLPCAGSSSAGLLQGIAHSLGASSALLCISWGPALVLSSECMPCSSTVLGLGHLASVSFLCGTQRSLVPGRSWRPAGSDTIDRAANSSGHTKARQCSSASSNTTFRALSEWHSKT